MSTRLTLWSRSNLVLACSFAALSTLGACSGEHGAAQDTGRSVSADTAGGAPTATANDVTAGSTTGASAGAAVTGRTVDVKMLGDAQGYRFEPASVTIHPGDGVRWTMVSGGPHNVTFWPDSIPAGMQQTLQANMPNTMAPFSGPLLSAPNATYTVSFAGAKPGAYHYYCTPHLALGMKGQVTVQ